MKTLSQHDPSILSCLVEVPRPNAQTDARWWPDLFLRKGRTLLQVTPEQASKLMDAKREAEAIRTGRGSSGVRDILLHDIDGNRIGKVSFNGRVWLHDIDGEKEIPLAGVWFQFDGSRWHGVNIGDNDIVRCRRTKGAR